MEILLLRKSCHNRNEIEGNQIRYNKMWPTAYQIPKNYTRCVNKIANTFKSLWATNLRPNTYAALLRSNLWLHQSESTGKINCNFTQTTIYQKC